MSILSDREIKDLCVEPSVSSVTAEGISNFRPMISPFVPNQVRYHDTEGKPFYPKTLEEFDKAQKVVSWGCSSFGYDVRLTNDFKIFSNINNTLLDPLNFDQQCCVDHKGSYCIIPPNSYILGKTPEYFIIPRDVTVVCVGKSTYARVGAIVNVTPIEAGFEGHIVIEISNATSLPLKVYANMGISQFLFFKGKVPCEVSYADRQGKYQGQTSIQTALA